MHAQVDKVPNLAKRAKHEAAQNAQALAPLVPPEEALPLENIQEQALSSHEARAFTSYFLVSLEGERGATSAYLAKALKPWLSPATPAHTYEHVGDGLQAALESIYHIKTAYTEGLSLLAALPQDASLPDLTLADADVDAATDVADAATGADTAAIAVTALSLAPENFKRLVELRKQVHDAVGFDLWPYWHSARGPSGRP